MVFSRASCARLVLVSGRVLGVDGIVGGVAEVGSNGLHVGRPDEREGPVRGPA